MKKIWCKLFHRRIMWPSEDGYKCAICFEEFQHFIKGDSEWYTKRLYAYRSTNTVLHGGRRYTGLVRFFKRG